MLSRRNSRSSGRLRRSHSASSVNSRRRSPIKSDAIDPRVAHRQALTAASLAYERSSGQEVAATREPQKRPRPSSMASAEPADGHGLSRQRSVRFAGAGAGLRPRPIRGSAYDTNNHRYSQASSVRTDSSFSRGRDRAHTMANSETESLFTMDEPNHHHLPDSGVASAPSSYRRLHRSKSMFNTKASASESSHDGKPAEPGAAESRQGGQLRSLRNNILRRPKSMTVLGDTPPSDSILDRGSRDAAVLMARETYRQQVEKHKAASLAPPPSARRHHKGLRKSVRSTSVSSFSDSVAPRHKTTESARTSLAVKSRNFSSSLRDKIKRAFHKSDVQSENDHAPPIEEIHFPYEGPSPSPTNEFESCPVQHLDQARIDQYRPPSAFEEAQVHGVPTQWVEDSQHRDNEQGNSATNSLAEEAQSPITPKKSISIVNSRLPSIHADSSNEELKSTTGSIIDSYAGNDLVDDRSRVTSWTDSTPVNTIAARHKGNFRSMSVIAEDEPLAVNDTESADGKVQSGAYEAFQHPMPEPAQGENGADSYRVFSALQRFIDDDEMAKDKVVSVQDNNDDSAIHAPASSPRSMRSSETIRQGLEKADSPLNEGILTTAEHWSSSRLPLEPHGTDSPSLRQPLESVEFQGPDGSERGFRQQYPFPWPLTSLQSSDKEDDPFPQIETSQNVQPLSSGLHETPPEYPYSAQDYQQVIGPYCESIDEPPVEVPAVSGLGPSDSSIQDRQNFRLGSSTDVASVYSRTTGGDSPLLIDSILAPQKIRMSNVPAELSGDIDADNPSSRASSNAFTNSLGSTVDWQTVLSSHVSKPEQRAHGLLQSRELARPRAFGHVREKAQIHDEDSSSDSDQNGVDLPLAERHGNAGGWGSKRKSTLRSLFTSRKNPAHVQEVFAENRQPPSTTQSGIPTNQNTMLEVESSGILADHSLRTRRDGPRSTARNAAQADLKKKVLNRAPSTPPSRRSSRPSAAQEPSPRTKTSPFWSSQFRSSPDRARKLAAYRPATRDENKRGVYKNFDQRVENKENLTPSPRLYDEGRGPHGFGDDQCPGSPSPESRKTVDLFLSRRRRQESRDSGVDAFI